MGCFENKPNLLCYSTNLGGKLVASKEELDEPDVGKLERLKVHGLKDTTNLFLACPINLAVEGQKLTNLEKIGTKQILVSLEAEYNVE